MPRGSRTPTSSEQGGRPRGGAPGSNPHVTCTNSRRLRCPGAETNPSPSSPRVDPAHLLDQPPHLRPLKPAAREIREQPPAPHAEREIGEVARPLLRHGARRAGRIDPLVGQRRPHRFLRRAPLPPLREQSPQQARPPPAAPG